MSDLNELAGICHAANAKWWQNPVTGERIERNAFGARLVHQPKSVFEQLDITFTREEWAAFNAKAGTNYPYPFADVISLRSSLKGEGE